MVPDWQKAVAIWSRCAERLSLWDVLGWQVVPSPSGSPLGLCQWGGGIPNKAALGKPESPVSPLPRFLIR